MPPRRATDPAPSWSAVGLRVVAFLMLAHSTEQAAAWFALAHGRVQQSQRHCSVDGHSIGVLLRSAGFGQGVGVRA